MAAPKHVYETFIKATPAEVWAAITRPEFTERYFHNTRFESDLTPGAGVRYVVGDGTTAVEGTIEELDIGERLVMTWHVLYDAAMADEPPSRVEWILRPADDAGSITRLTLRHFDLGLSPRTSDNVAVGWVGVLDGMKTLLETGEPLGEVLIDDAGAAESPASAGDRSEHRRLAAAANGEAWELLASDELAEGDREELVERGYASAYHWRRATEPGAVEQARAAWLLARIHALLGHPDAAVGHAERCSALTAAADGADFDTAYAHEALARAYALAGRVEEAAKERVAAASVAIADPQDREIFEADLAAEPWFGLEA